VVEERGSCPEAFSMALPCRQELQVVKVAATEEVGCAVVLGRPQVSLPGVHPASGITAGLGNIAGLLSRRPPLIVPAVVVFFCNTLGGSEAFAYVRAAIIGLKDRSLQLTVELFVVEVQFHRCASSFRSLSLISPCANGVSVDQVKPILPHSRIVQE
jgi:hypothetical protein